MSDIFGFPDEEEPEGRYYGEEYNPYESFTYTPVWEERYTIYGDGAHRGQSWTMTGQEWVGEAYLDQYSLIELYGLDNLDIIEDLMDQGYDYLIQSDITGEWISGLWEDWRELYGETA